MDRGAWRAAACGVAQSRTQQHTRTLRVKSCCSDAPSTHPSQRRLKPHHGHLQPSRASRSSENKSPPTASKALHSLGCPCSPPHLISLIFLFLLGQAQLHTCHRAVPQTLQAPSCLRAFARLFPLPRVLFPDTRVAAHPHPSGAFPDHLLGGASSLSSPNTSSAS